MSNINLVAVDQSALEPSGPVKPKKVLVLLFSLSFGFLVGVTFVVARGFIIERRAALDLKQV
jgi:uncharacterized protein involved in exopolysaccharide biosynthesis